SRPDRAEACTDSTRVCGVPGIPLTGEPEEPGPPGGRERVADEDDGVDHEMRHEERKQPATAREEHAEQQLHEQLAHERYLATVEVVALQQHRGRHDDRPDLPAE